MCVSKSIVFSILVTIRVVHLMEHSLEIVKKFFMLILSLLLIMVLDRTTHIMATCLYQYTPSYKIRFVYFTLDYVYKVKAVFIMVLDRTTQIMATCLYQFTASYKINISIYLEVT